MSAPSFAPRQSTERPPDLSPVLVRKMRSPQRTGAECPLPGNSTFQLMSASLIFVGMLLAWLMPVPFGPRKRVHSWAVLEEANEPRPAATSVVARNVFRRIVLISPHG